MVPLSGLEWFKEQSFSNKQKENIFKSQGAREDLTTPTRVSCLQLDLIFIYHYFLLKKFFGPKACGILASQLGIEPWPLAVKPLGPDHWTAREFPMKFIYLFIYLFLAALGLHCCIWAFCSCGKRGLLSSLWCTGFSLRWLLLWSSGCSMLQQLRLSGFRAQAQQLQHMGLAALWHVRSSQTRDRPRVPCIARQILTHCHQGSPIKFKDYLENYKGS